MRHGGPDSGAEETPPVSLRRLLVLTRNTTAGNRVPILVKNVATVRVGPALKRGDGSFNGRSALVATIQKQPHANTPEVTRQIEATLATMRPRCAWTRPEHDQPRERAAHYHPGECR